jgi:hypothetical protein
VNRSIDPEQASVAGPVVSNSEIAPPFQPFSFGEPPSLGGFASFDFTFDAVPPTSVADDSGFVFDQNDQLPQQDAGDQLFGRFRELLSSSCFERAGPPMADLFKQEDETESAEVAYGILMGPE